MDISKFGHSDYDLGKLDLGDLNPSPFVQFETWLKLAIETDLVIEPSAMSLATVGEEGRPSVRMVLLRGLDTGLVFYTNYLSRKGNDMASNQHAAICLWWGALEKQIRVEGLVSKMSNQESDQYFGSRSRDSQAASAISPQSQIISDRVFLEREMADLLERKRIQRPDSWGGYRLIPTYFEFWQGRKARLHDRFCYVLIGNEWSIHRLAP
jgi:pyridoxamine 5'-phosphate oxidase